MASSSFFEEIPEIGFAFWARRISFEASCHSLLPVVFGGGLAIGLCWECRECWADSENSEEIKRILSLILNKNNDN